MDDTEYEAMLGAVAPEGGKGARLLQDSVEPMGRSL